MYNVLNSTTLLLPHNDNEFFSRQMQDFIVHIEEQANRIDNFQNYILGQVYTLTVPPIDQIQLIASLQSEENEFNKSTDYTTFNWNLKSAEVDYSAKNLQIELQTQSQTSDTYIRERADSLVMSRKLGALYMQQVLERQEKNIMNVYSDKIISDSMEAVGYTTTSSINTTSDSMRVFQTEIARNFNVMATLIQQSAAVHNQLRDALTKVVNPTYDTTATIQEKITAIKIELEEKTDRLNRMINDIDVIKLQMKRPFPEFDLCISKIKSAYQYWYHGRRNDEFPSESLEMFDNFQFLEHSSFINIQKNSTNNNINSFAKQVKRKYSAVYSQLQDTYPSYLPLPDDRLLQIPLLRIWNRRSSYVLDAIVELHRSVLNNGNIYLQREVFEKVKK